MVTELYRTVALSPVAITIHVAEINDLGHWPHYPYPMIYLQFSTAGEKFGVQLLFKGWQILHSYPEEQRQRRLNAAINQSILLAKWMIFNGTFKEMVVARDYIVLRHQNGTMEDMPRETPRMIKLSSRDSIEENSDYIFDANEDEITIAHPPLMKLAISEHKLARKIILDMLYKESKSGGLIVQAAHFPHSIIARELSALLSAGIVTQQIAPTGNILKELTLSLSGREYYEKSMATSSNVIFIIAACENSNRPVQHEVIDTYKRVAQDLGYTAKFQEHEEPHRNIHVDIFDYIDSCEFVIADITHERADCYVEIGYAMAKQKPILLFVEESNLDTMRENRRFPFDLSVVKYQTYSRDRLDELEKYCKERIVVLQQRKAAL